MENDVLISIVVCCYNEEKHIKQSLESLLQQQGVPGNIEILVYDGMSTDRTRDIISELASKDPRLMLFENPFRQKSPAVNMGFRRSKGKYLAICDAHSFYEKNYFSSLYEVIQQVPPDVVCVGGPIDSIGVTDFGKATALAMSSLIGVGNAMHRIADYEGYSEMAIFPLFKRELLDDVGYYDESLNYNHDDEWCYRIRKKGYRIYLSRKAKSTYYVRNTPGGLFSQYFNYGYGTISVIKKHKETNALRQMIPTAFFSAVILMIVVSLITGNLVFAVILPAIYLMAIFISFLATLIKTTFSIAKYFPLAVFLLHFSYASGYFSGIVNSIRTKRTGEWMNG